jgi:hypothetical protein
MNAKFKAWLLSHGFLQSGKSCLFVRLLPSTSRAAAVWLHKHGGQAEIRSLPGKKLARLESWKSIEELQEFFGKELE